MGFLAGDDAVADLINRACGGYEQGKWTINADLALGTPTLINNWVPYIGTSGQVNSGISVAAGVFTVGVGGEYFISLSVRHSATAAGGHYCFIAGSGTTQTWSKSSETGALNTSCAVSMKIPAGGNFRCYGYSSPGSNATREGASDLVTGVAVYRLGN
ncbi:hypothetical protein [Amycolatopsis eburnea]|uniref:Uncharacterized protein n=1 Tax=Amycolatopsis eburnea TaxID=2267691 RepID=A0A3R9KU98_9PSEU|nr:hypothetical protein [Amycolatopsis eburnea]RSD26343.1 hypothetical protein EIY87_00320 [Amycolatopsis eburnea]